MITLDAVRRLGRIHRSPPEPGVAENFAAVALILVPGPGGLETLFIRRAVRTGDPWSAQIALPGGRRDPTDPGLEHTALRETREELAIDLGLAERLGPLDDLSPRTQLLPPIVVRPFVFALPDRPALTPSDEVQSAFWVPLGRLLEPGARRTVTIPLPGGERSFDAYILGQDIIWGMTERIVWRFLSEIWPI